MIIRRERMKLNYLLKALKTTRQKPAALSRLRSHPGNLPRIAAAFTDPRDYPKSRINACLHPLPDKLERNKVARTREINKTAIRRVKLLLAGP